MRQNDVSLAPIVACADTRENGRFRGELACHRQSQPSIPSLDGARFAWLQWRAISRRLSLAAGGMSVLNDTHGNWPPCRLTGTVSDVQFFW